jgi:hypothetical protein
MNWVQFKNTILDSPFKGDWQVKFGEAFYTGEAGDAVACVRVKVPPETLDPAQRRVEAALKEEEVEFEYQTYSLEHGINGESDLEGFNGLLSYLFPGIFPSVYPSLPANYRRPERFDFSPQELKYFRGRKISRTPVAPLYGQHRDYFGETVLELNANPDLGQMEDWPVRYRQGWIERIVCPFCQWEGFSSIHAVALRYPEQVHYSGDYLMLICPRCERAIESIPYK